MDGTALVDKSALDLGFRPPPHTVFGKLTVGEVMSLHGTTSRLLGEDALADAAEVMAASCRTAVAVADAEGCLAGLLTVNDVMRAYFEGAAPTTPLKQWLKSGRARAPSKRLQRLAVQPSALLARVASKMVANAVAGDCACHHVVVQEDDGQLRGMLSSHDLVAVLTEQDVWAQPPASEAAPTIAKLTVRELMKPSAHVFTCSPTDTMKDALKVLLVTQQNSLLVVSESGVRGLVTTRDASRAFSDGFNNSMTISDWLSSRPKGVERRLIGLDTPILDAAAKMTEGDIDHLVVVREGSPDAVGVLSSMDVMLHTKPHAPILRALPFWKGPTVADILSEESHLTEIYDKGFTLGQAAKLMAKTGRTSVILEMCKGEAKHELLTENEVLRAYLESWESEAPAEDLLTTTEAEHVRLLHQFHVLPSMCLTDAASLMLSAAEPSHTCHHLVVRDVAVDSDWLGVFSALDIARALSGLSSELEVAKTGTDHTTVDAIMKPISSVPVCSPTDSMYTALNALDIYGQNAAIIEDEGGFQGLLTARCALEAFAEGVPKEEKVGEWLRRQKENGGGDDHPPRRILLGTKLMEAASIMTQHSLHHLLVVESPGAAPAGLLSSLDVARGVVSINYHCPFVTLGWLRLFGGATRLQVEDKATGSDASAAEEPEKKRARLHQDADGHPGATAAAAASSSSSSSSLAAKGIGEADRLPVESAT